MPRRLHVQPNFSSISTAVLLRGALAKLNTEIRGSGAQISYGDLPQVPGDPDRLMQLFENLLRNAIEHRGDAPPCIQVSAQLQNAEWLFAVRDNGPASRRKTWNGSSARSSGFGGTIEVLDWVWQFAGRS